MPKALERKPVLYSDLEYVLEAYTVIARSRARTGFGLSKITLSDVKAYFDTFDISDQDEKERIIYLVFAMDDEYIEYIEQGKKQRKEIRRGDTKVGNRR